MSGRSSLGKRVKGTRQEVHGKGCQRCHTGGHWEKGLEVPSSRSFKEGGQGARSLGRGLRGAKHETFRKRVRSARQGSLERESKR